MSKRPDLSAGKFALDDTRENGTIHRPGSLSTSYLEARILNLEEKHVSLQEDVSALKELYAGVSSTVEKLNRGGPSQDIDAIEASLETARQFGMEMTRLKESVCEPVDYDSNNTAKDPAAHQHGNELESGITSNRHKHPMPVPAPTPPRSNRTPTLSIEDKQAWKPYHLTTLAPFSGPIPGNIITFHPDFLANHLGGIPWSPGLRFITGKGPSILKNRTYYQIDPENEPYLPQAPGEHGAKLTAFFNKAPEEEFGYLFADNASSYEDVPMFVLVDKRYVYYGNYSQTRWSDKLDHDTMMTRVPDHVKKFWAEELTSPVREKWVTEELKKHFFRKPEYSGRIFPQVENETTADSAEDAKLTEKMMKDVRKYVDELRQWDREASMKTAMIKKQSILDAFNASDMDEEPALRLWWEYLECVNWRKDFYDLLVALQQREGQKYA